MFELHHVNSEEALATELDGVDLVQADRVPLSDDGTTHHVRVRVPRPQAMGRFS